MIYLKKLKIWMNLNIIICIWLIHLKDKKYDMALETFDVCIQKDYKIPEIYHAKGRVFLEIEIINKLYNILTQI